MLKLKDPKKLEVCWKSVWKADYKDGNFLDILWKTISRLLVNQHNKYDEVLKELIRYFELYIDHISPYASVNYKKGIL